MDDDRAFHSLIFSISPASKRFWSWFLISLFFDSLLFRWITKLFVWTGQRIVVYLILFFSLFPSWAASPTETLPLKASPPATQTPTSTAPLTSPPAAYPAVLVGRPTAENKPKIPPPVPPRGTPKNKRGGGLGGGKGAQHDYVHDECSSSLLTGAHDSLASKFAVGRFLSNMHHCTGRRKSCPDTFILNYTQYKEFPLKPGDRARRRKKSFCDDILEVSYRPNEVHNANIRYISANPKKLLCAELKLKSFESVESLCSRESMATLSFEKLYINDFPIYNTSYRLNMRSISNQYLDKPNLLINSIPLKFPDIYI